MRKFIDIINEAQCTCDHQNADMEADIDEASDPELIKAAKKMDVDTDSIPAVRDFENLRNFHTDFMNKVSDRVNDHSTTVQDYIDAGKFPLAIGTRILTPKLIGFKLTPYEITGYYVDQKNKERYGYRVKASDESSILMISDPKTDILIKKNNPDWDRAGHIASWKILGGLKSVK